jgi:hypothetical protein
MSAIYGLARFHKIPPSRILAMQERQEVVWPMYYRTPHPDGDIEDWLEDKSKNNVTSIALQASSDYAGSSHDEIEAALPMRYDETTSERKSN